MDVATLNQHCQVLYDSNNQAQRMKVELELIEVLGTEAGIQTARRVVQAHGADSNALNVHLVCSHPSCLPTVLSTLKQCTSEHIYAGMFAATCLKGCVSEYYQQFPDSTAAQLQEELWNLVVADAGGEARLSGHVCRTVLYTVVRIACYAWVDDERVQNVPKLCLARLVASHAGSRSILGMKQAQMSGQDGSVANIPLEVAQYVIEELIRTFAVSNLPE
jgi:hypothetical protein